MDIDSLRGDLGSIPRRLPYTVLCVDSDIAARANLQSALPECQIMCASGAYEALRKINLRPFDLYVLDYWLPDWSGVSLCRDIRKTDPHVPICFYTDMEDPEHRQRAERAGASGYLSKLLVPEILQGELSSLLKLKAQRDEAAGIAAWAWIQQELAHQIAGSPAATSQDDGQKTGELNARTKARNVFLEAKGTLAGFHRAWQLPWTKACSTLAKATSSLA